MIERCMVVFALVGLLTQAGCDSTSQKDVVSSKKLDLRGVIVVKEMKGSHYLAALQITDRDGPVAAPQIVVARNQWGKFEIVDTDSPHTYEAKVAMGEETLSISHKPGQLLKIKVVPSANKQMVAVRGVFSIAGESGDGQRYHKVFPFTANCKLGQKSPLLKNTSRLLTKKSSSVPGKQK